MIVSATSSRDGQTTILEQLQCASIIAAGFATQDTSIFGYGDDTVP